MISRENLHEEERLRAALVARFGDRVRLLDTLGAVSVDRRRHQRLVPEPPPRLGRARRRGIVAEHVATSSFRITWMIDRARLDDAVRLLHATFIESQSG